MEYARRSFRVHMPNGSQNGWEKVKTFNALADFLRKNRGRPCVFGGDFNETRKFLSGGDIISFGHRIGKNGGFTLQGNRKDKFGECRPPEEWHDAVEAVLTSGTAHTDLRASSQKFPVGLKKPPTRFAVLTVSSIICSRHSTLLCITHSIFTSGEEKGYRIIPRSEPN